MELIVYCRSFEVALMAGPDVADVTDEIGRVVAASGVGEGSAQAAVVAKVAPASATATTIRYGDFMIVLSIF